MSHVDRIDTVPIKDIAALKSAVEELGGELRENKKTYNWYGRHVGDHPLPKGIKQEMLGKCEHAAGWAGVNYECGFIQVNGEEGLTPIYDFYGGGGTHDGRRLEGFIGKNAGKLMQCYTKHATINAAVAQGYTVTGTTTDAQGNIHVEIAVSY